MAGIERETGGRGIVLIEKTLFETINKPVAAIARLQQFEAAAVDMHPGGYYFATSFGKDSIVVHDLIRRAGVKFTAHNHVTTCDPPELIKFGRKYYPDVIRNKPEMSMWALIEKKMMPPTRIVRYCCEVLKEGGGRGRMVVTGIRKAESSKRASRQVVERCYRKRSTVFLNPIIDWLDSDVWDYIRENNLPYCCLYDEEFTRLGCVGCPATNTKTRIKEFERWPKIKAKYMKAFARAVEARKHLEGKKEYALNWDTAEAMFDWWMNENRKQTDKDQLVLFE